MSSKPASAAPLPAGSVLGDYEIEELCGESPLAQVYRAVHTRLGRRAEISLHHEALVELTTLERFQQKAKALSCVHHPNVLSLYDYEILDDGRAYVAREWVKGAALSDDAEAGATMPQSAILTLLKDLCSAVAALHRAAIVHGRLSLSCLKIEKETGCLKVTGIAIVEASEPETVESKYTDLHSLGSLIRLLFTTHSAFKADHDGAPLLPSKINAIVDRCISTDPDCRINSADEIWSELELALETKHVHDDALPTGTLIGDSYRVCGIIGVGGMGKVYEAVHKRLPQRVAIKVISGQYTEESLARFRQEAEIASSMGHPHIVRVIDFNSLADGRPYMVMEFLQGQDLAETLRSETLTPERALRIAAHVGSALSAAHDKGIVHRDLKPSNIFLRTLEIGGERLEHATVLDFGICKRVDAGGDITRTASIIGTPKYMAPEQALGDNERVSALSDQFSLACIVYEMLSGQRAFGGRDLAEIVFRVCSEEPTALDSIVSELDASVVAAVTRAMSKVPEKRFPSIAEFIAALCCRPIVSNSAATETQKKQPTQEDFSGPTLGAGEQPMAPLANGSSTQEPEHVDESKIQETEAESGPVFEEGAQLSTRIYAMVAGVAVLSIAAIAAIMHWRSSDSVPLVARPAPVLQSARAEPALPLMAVLFDAGATTAVTFDAGMPDATVAAPASKRPHQRQRTTKPKADEKELTEHLDRAEAMLEAGRYRETRRGLREDQNAAKSNRGYALTVMSYCGENNFGAATDWFPRVTKPYRRQVRIYCKKNHDIDLE